MYLDFDKKMAALEDEEFSFSWDEYLRDEEYKECVEDIFEHPLFQSMSEFIQHGTTTTLEHSIRVSYLSYRICKRLSWDARAAARAGLLHDFFLYDWHTHARTTGERFHGLTHPRKALENARREFKLTSMEENMILRHMWPLTPIPPKSLEGMALVYADKVCGFHETAEPLKNMYEGIRYGLLGRVYR